MRLPLSRLAMAAIPALLFLCSGLCSSARADTFSFTTSGVFSNIPAASGCVGNATNTITCSDGRSVVFVGSTFSQVYPANNVVVTGTPFGTFQTRNIAPSTVVGPLLPKGIALTITITQLGPAPASGELTGVLDVSQEGIAAYNIFRFDPTPLVLEGENYRSTFSASFFYFPSINYVPSSIVSINNVPEPTTVLLLGTGLTALGAAVRRRRRGVPGRRHQARGV